MKIVFSFQMREMPKHTANMNAVTSRATWENARGDRPHIYTGVKPCVNLLYFNSNELVLELELELYFYLNTVNLSDKIKNYNLL